MKIVMVGCINQFACETFNDHFDLKLVSPSHIFLVTRKDIHNFVTLLKGYDIYYGNFCGLLSESEYLICYLKSITASVNHNNLHGY